MIYGWWGSVCPCIKYYHHKKIIIVNHGILKWPLFLEYPQDNQEFKKHDFHHKSCSVYNMLMQHSKVNYTSLVCGLKDPNKTALVGTNSTSNSPSQLDKRDHSSNHHVAYLLAYPLQHVGGIWVMCKQCTHKEVRNSVEVGNMTPNASTSWTEEPCPAEFPLAKVHHTFTDC